MEKKRGGKGALSGRSPEKVAKNCGSSREGETADGVTREQ